MENCPICINKMTEETSVSTMCNHQYCKECLDTWLENHNTCPLCRFEIYEMEDNDSDDSDDERDLPVDFVERLLERLVGGILNIPHDRFVLGASMDRAQMEIQHILEQEAHIQNERVELEVIEELAFEERVREELQILERDMNNRSIMIERINRNIEEAHREQDERIMRRRREAEEEHIRRRQQNED